MWDRPEILNPAASALLAVALLLAGYAAVIFVARQPMFALHTVRIGNELAHVTREQIESVVRRELHGNFFTVDLEQARIVFEKLPWVRNASVRRQWPDRLDVALEEHVPLARWGSEALVNSHGEVFGAAYDGKLPVFAGPPGSAKEIAIQYDYFRRSLAVLAQIPVQVQVSERGAWQVRFASGTVLELGRDHVEARLERFVAVYARTVGRLQRRLEYIDLRYGNGFAVRIPELRGESHDGRRGGRAGAATG